VTVMMLNSKERGWLWTEKCCDFLQKKLYTLFKHLLQPQF